MAKATGDRARKRKTQKRQGAGRAAVASGEVVAGVIELTVDAERASNKELRKELLRDALEGDKASARLLGTRTEFDPPIDAEEVSEALPSVALALAAEPQWEGCPVEATGPRAGNWGAE